MEEVGGGGGKGFRAQIFEQMRDCSYYGKALTQGKWTKNFWKKSDSLLASPQTSFRSSLFYRLIETEVQGTKLRRRGSSPYGTELQNCI